MKKVLLFSIFVFIVSFGYSQKSVQRISVLEQFTTENCGYCPPVLTIMENHLSENSNFIMMGHHAGYGTDWLTIPENSAHLEFYGGSTFAPAGMVDRHYNGLDNDDYNGVDPGPVFWDGDSYGTDRIDGRTVLPAYVTVNINGTHEGNNYSLTVSGDFLQGFEQSIGVSLWITEDNITTTNQSGVSGTWTHRFTTRDAISSRLGNVITTAHNTGDTYSMEFNYSIDEAWDFDNLYLVTMVSNIDDDNVNNRGIHNAKQVKLSELSPLLVSKINSKIKIYPTFASKIITVVNAKDFSVTISNIIGQKVYTEEIVSNNQRINISNLKNGTYFVKISNNYKIETKKIIISK